MEINTKMHWLELSTMTHVVRKQNIYLLTSDRVTFREIPFFLQYAPTGSVSSLYSEVGFLDLERFHI